MGAFAHGGRAGTVWGRPGWPHEWVVLGRAGGFTFVAFGALAGVGGFAGAWVTVARQLQAGLPVVGLVWPLAVSVPVLGVLGARVYALFVVEGSDLRRDPWATLPRTTLAWQGAVAAVGAFVVGLAWVRGLPVAPWIDTFAFGLPIGQAFGRLGCHTYGCCHGRPTSVPWAIVVHNPASKVVWGSGLGGVALHPAQLYAFAANVAVAGLLVAIAAGGPLPGGRVAAVYLIADGVFRFGLEGVRGVRVRRWFGRTPFQGFAVAQIGVGGLVASVEAPAVDFASGFGAALAAAAPGWPAYVACGVAMFLLMGIHRGDPGGITLAASRTLGRR